MKVAIVVLNWNSEKYVGECLDLPVVTQGKTVNETLQNIKEVLALHLEDEESNI